MDVQFSFISLPLSLSLSLSLSHSTNLKHLAHKIFHSLYQLVPFTQSFYAARFYNATRFYFVAYVKQQ